MTTPTLRYVPFEEVQAACGVVGPPNFHYFVINRRRCVYHVHADAVFRVRGRSSWYCDSSPGARLPDTETQLAKAYLRLIS